MLITFLWANTDVFAWQPSDRPGIPREVIEHKLSIQPDAKLAKQKLQRFALDRKEAIKEEIKRFAKVGFIQGVDQSEWLANPVMVKKIK